MAPACAAASSGVSAKRTPPAFIRPPARTCDLITVGPPISSATRRASCAVVASSAGATAMPARRTISRDSYSKNLLGAGSVGPPRSPRKPE